MKDRFRDFPLTVEEVRRLMKKEDAKRATWIAVGVGVIAVLVGLVIWIAKRRDKDLEEHYEYFDEDFDELDEDFEEFDDSIYDDETEDEEEIEYVKINDFMNADNEETALETEETDKVETNDKEEATTEA